MVKFKRSKGENERIAQSRYGANYPKICAIAHRATNGICCYCMNNPSEEIHHIMYRDENGLIYDREIPGVHVFPLCLKCHVPIAHNRVNWRRYKDESRNANTVEFQNLLKSNFLTLNRMM